jgi:dolichol-phosphate mannosyltransferase
VIRKLPYAFHIYFIDDGSTDRTVDSLTGLAKQEEDITVLRLARNFGHQAALTAGLDASCGDFVISMDADGQHPPEMIPEMIQLFEQGYDIVQAQRIEQERGVSFKQITSTGFYSLINRISGTHIEPGAADFRGMSRQTVDALKSMPEYHRFLRGMIAWMGYRSVILPYHETKRTAGMSKYSFGKMFRLAMDAIFSFSLMPLYIGMTLGGILLCLAAIQISMLVIGGMVMILLGFIGVYVGYIFQEVKRRPVYLLKKDDEK